jgi:hypothetical protein
VVIQPAAPATSRVQEGKKYRFISIHGGDEFDIEEV